MAVYGEYETIDEYHSGARTAVWRARRAGGSRTETFAVKIYRTGEWDEDAAVQTADLTAFTTTANEQHAVSGKRPRHWAPVLAVGQKEKEAFWVTRFYPRTLERIVEGRARLSAADLHWIVSSIVRGLSDLEAEAHRPHGNLKTSNVFIDGDGLLRGAPILLSDPKPKSAVAMPADRAADFQALGRIIVHLVRRRASDLRAAIGWPLEPSGEWKSVGRHADAWRELCNLLLKPNPTVADLDLAEIERRLIPLEKTGRPLWVKATAVAVPVLVVAGGVFYLRTANYQQLPEGLKKWALMVGNVPPDRINVPEEWAKLCLAYANWFAPFLEDIDRKAPLTNAYLIENIVNPLKEFRKGDPRAFEPRHIADPTDELRLAAAKDLAARPPQAAKKEDVAVRTIKTWAVVDGLSQVVLKWPERVHLAETATLVETLGWKATAAKIRTTAQVGTDGVLEARTLNGISAVIAASRQSEGLWADVERSTTALGASGDPVMRGLPAYFRLRLADAEALQVNGTAIENIRALNAQLTGVKERCAQFAALVQDNTKFDRDRFLKESSIAGFKGAVTDEVLDKWQRELQEDYAVVAVADDPRKTVNWEKLKADIEKSLADLASEKSPEIVKQVGVFRAEQQAVRQGVDTLLGGKVIRKDRTTVEKTVRQLQEKFTQLESLISAQFPDPEPWFKRKQEREFGAEGSPLRREWDRRRERLLGSVDRTRLNSHSPEFKDLRERFGPFETYFTVLANERGLGGLAAFDSAGIDDKKVAGEIDTVAGALVAKTSEDLLALLPGSDPVPRGTAEDLIAGAAWREVMSRHTATLKAFVDLGRDFSTLAVQLGQGFGLDAQLDTLVSRWRNRAEFQAAENAPTIQGLLRDVADLIRLNGDTNIVSLTTAARAQTLGVALAAWRRLGLVAEWATPGNLPLEEELQGALQKRINSEVRDRDRRLTLLDELSTGTGKRWLAALRGARDDAAMATVLALREKFGVSPDKLQPAERFNVELYQAKSVDWRNLPQTALLKQRDELVVRLRSILGVPVPPTIEKWLRDLAEVMLTDAGSKNADVTKLGPGAMGWTGTTPDGKRVTFKWSAGAQAAPQELIFQFVESDSLPPFFLCTTEFPVGLMLDLMAGQPAVNKKLTDDLTVAEGDGRLGPQVWRIAQKRVRLSPNWINTTHPSYPKPLYPEDLAAAGPPTKVQPVQYIPPGIALYLARDVLGCRLPSPDEWSEIVKLAHKNADHVNLRDAAWIRERDYLVEKGVDGANSPIDAEIFFPKGSGNPKRGREAQPAANARSDSQLWFGDVSGTATDEFHHLFGNVAEFLYDDDKKQFFVAGGSALSPPEIDPATIYPVNDRTAQTGFSDVGFRLAFSAPGELAGRIHVQQLIRNLPFFRP